MVICDEVPREIWRLILEKLCLTDHIPFSGVCRLWRSIGLEYRSIKIPTHVPGLIIPGSNNMSSQTCRFLAYPVGKKININKQGHEHEHDNDLAVLSIPHESLCRGSYQGWLVMVDKSMSMYLQNPLSGARIDLPPVTSLPRSRPVATPKSKWYVRKAVLSTSPSSSTSSDCFVLVFYAGDEVFYAGDELAFCKVGDKAWKPVSGPVPWGYIGAIFHKEQFYIVDDYGGVYVSESLSGPDQPKVKIKLGPPPLRCPFMQTWYLVELGGELLQILRIFNVHDLDEEEEEEEEGEGNNEIDNGNEEDGSGNENEEEEEEEDGNNGENYEINNNEFDDFDYDNNYFSSVRKFTYQTTKFIVFKLDTSGSEPKWVDVKDLDGGAVFLGYNQSFALSKSNLMGYKGDRIYYTDDYSEAQKLYGDASGDHQVYACLGYDAGVFNLEDSSFEALYTTESESIKPPAVWMTPMPW